MSCFYPFELAKYICMLCSQPYTAAFSNVAGPLKKRNSSDNYESSNTSESDLISEPKHISGVMTPGGGSIPMTLTCLSQNNVYRIALCCEKGCLPDYKGFFDLVIKNIQFIES